MTNKRKKISIIAALTTASLAVMHISNKLVFYLSTMKELLYNKDSHFYPWRFGNIYYTKTGHGPAVLLIHDLHSSSSHYEWKDIVDELSKTNTVYTIDLIGCGRSDKPKITYTNYLYVQLVNDFIKNVIQEKTTVITSRNSCAISIMGCYIDSDLFNNLILVNPTDLRSLNKYPKKKHKTIKLLLEIPIIGTFIYNCKSSRIQLRHTFKKKYFSKKTPTTRCISAYSEAAHTSGASSKYVYTSIRCHYTNTNISQALNDINNSIYIVGGSDAKDIDNIIELYKHYNPAIEECYIDHTSGLPQLEQPAAFLDTVKMFL